MKTKKNIAKTEKRKRLAIGSVLFLGAVSAFSIFYFYDGKDNLSLDQQLVGIGGNNDVVVVQSNGDVINYNVKKEGKVDQLSIKNEITDASKSGYYLYAQDKKRDILYAYERNKHVLYKITKDKQGVLKGEEIAREVIPIADSFDVTEKGDLLFVQEKEKKITIYTPNSDKATEKELNNEIKEWITTKDVIVYANKDYVYKESLYGNEKPMKWFMGEKVKELRQEAGNIYAITTFGETDDFYTLIQIPEKNKKVKAIQKIEGTDAFFIEDDNKREVYVYKERVKEENQKWTDEHVVSVVQQSDLSIKNTKWEFKQRPNEAKIENNRLFSKNGSTMYVYVKNEKEPSKKWKVKGDSFYVW